MVRRPRREAVKDTRHRRGRRCPREEGRLVFVGRTAGLWGRSTFLSSVSLYARARSHASWRAPVP